MTQTPVTEPNANEMPTRDLVLAQLWQFGKLGAEQTRGSITGQVKALSIIAAMEGYIPDRRFSRAQTQAEPVTPPIKPSIYVGEPFRRQQEQQAEAAKQQPPATPAPAQPDPPHPAAHSQHPNWVPGATSFDARPSIDTIALSRFRGPRKNR